jgi:hypothetical protein
MEDLQLPQSYLILDKGIFVFLSHTYWGVFQVNSKDLQASLDTKQHVASS